MEDYTIVNTFNNSEIEFSVKNGQLEIEVRVKCASGDESVFFDLDSEQVKKIKALLEKADEE